MTKYFFLVVIQMEIYLYFCIYLVIMYFHKNFELGLQKISHLFSFNLIEFNRSQLELNYFWCSLFFSVLSKTPYFSLWQWLHLIKKKLSLRKSPLTFCPYNQFLVSLSRWPQMPLGHHTLTIYNWKWALTLNA